MSKRFIFLLVVAVSTAFPIFLVMLENAYTIRFFTPSVLASSLTTTGFSGL